MLLFPFLVSIWEVERASAFFLAVFPSFVLMFTGLVLRTYVSGLDWEVEQGAIFTSIPRDPVSLHYFLIYIHIINFSLLSVCN